MKSLISQLTPDDLHALAELAIAIRQAGGLANILAKMQAGSLQRDAPVVNLSIPEACKRIGNSKSWLYAQQTVPGSKAPRIRKAGHRAFVRSDDVERFIMGCQPLHKHS